MARGSLRLIHQKACAADGADPRVCSCSPRVQARVAGHDYSIGYLAKGWLMRDLEPFDRKLLDMRDAIVEGRSPRPREVVTLEEFGPPWFQQLHAAARMGSVSPLTYNSYEGNWRLHIRPFFGRYALGAIDALIVNKYIADKLESGLSRNTVMSSLTVLSGMLTDAQAEGKIAANPLRSPRRGRHGSRRVGVQLTMERKPPKHLELDEAIALLEVTPLEQLDLVLGPLTTGFRRNEWLAVEWTDLDWGRSVVDLTGQLYRGEKVHAKCHSERVVPFFSGLAAVLGRRRRAEGWVTDVGSGGPMNEKDAGQVIDHLYTDAGLKRRVRARDADGNETRQWDRKGLGFHALRHTYNSVLASHGVPRHVRAELLGHKKGDITGRYEHVLSGEFAKVEAALEAAFGDVVRRRLGQTDVHEASRSAPVRTGPDVSSPDPDLRSMRL